MPNMHRRRLLKLTTTLGLGWLAGETLTRRSGHDRTQITPSDTKTDFGGRYFVRDWLDTSAKIQNRIDLHTMGGEFFIPQTTIEFSQSLIPKSNVRLVGVRGHTTLKATADIIALIRAVSGTVGVLKNLELENLIIDMDKANVTYSSNRGYGIEQWAATGSEAEYLALRRVSVLNAGKYGVTLSRCLSPALEDIEVENAGVTVGDRSISIAECENPRLMRARVRGGTSVGVALHTCTNPTVRDSVVEDTGNNGFQIYDCTSGSISGSRGTGNALNGCEIDGSRGFNAINNEFCQNNFHGLHVARDTAPMPVLDVNLVANKCHRNKFAGISIQGLRRGSIAANACYDNAQAQDPAWRSGIQIQKNTVHNIVPDALVLMGNICTDRQAEKTQDYGIWLRDELMNSSVVGNSCLGNRIAGVENSTASSTVVVANNI